VYTLYKENAAGVGLFKGGVWTQMTSRSPDPQLQSIS